MSEAWQIALVALIEALAVAYLVSRFWARSPRARSKKPDVPITSIVRKKR